MSRECPKENRSRWPCAAFGGNVRASPGRFLAHALFAPSDAFRPDAKLPSPAAVYLFLLLIDLTLGQLSFSISSRACRELGLFQITPKHARQVSNVLHAAELELYVGSPLEILARAVFRTAFLVAFRGRMGSTRLTGHRVNIALLVALASQSPKLLLRALEAEESWRRGPSFTLDLVPAFGFETPWVDSPAVPIDSEILWNCFPSVAGRLAQIFVLARGIGVGLGHNAGMGLLAAVGIGVGEFVALDANLFRMARGIMSRG